MYLLFLLGKPLPVSLHTPVFVIFENEGRLQFPAHYKRIQIGLSKKNKHHVADFINWTQISLIFSELAGWAQW